MHDDPTAGPSPDRLETGEITDPIDIDAHFAGQQAPEGFAGGSGGAGSDPGQAGGGAGGGQAVDYLADPETGSIDFAGAAAKPWDDPAGAAFADQLQNMEHDLRAALVHGAAVDPAIAERQRQQLALKAGSANAAKVDQQGTIGLGLFDAADQFGFQLDEHGAPVRLRDVLNEIDAEDAAIQAAKDCL